MTDQIFFRRMGCRGFLSRGCIRLLHNLKWLIIKFIYMKQLKNFKVAVLCIFFRSCAGIGSAKKTFAGLDSGFLAVLWS